MGKGRILALTEYDIRHSLIFNAVNHGHSPPARDSGDAPADRGGRVCPTHRYPPHRRRSLDSGQEELPDDLPRHGLQHPEPVRREGPAPTAADPGGGRAFRCPGRTAPSLHR